MVDNSSSNEIPDSVLNAALLVRLQCVVSLMRARGVELAGRPEHVRWGAMRIPLVGEAGEAGEAGEGLRHSLVLVPIWGPLQLDLVPTPSGGADAVAYLRGVGFYEDRPGEVLTLEDVEFDGVSQIVGPISAATLAAEWPYQLAPVGWGGCKREHPVTLRLRPGDGATLESPHVVALIVAYDYHRVPAPGQGGC